MNRNKVTLQRTVLTYASGTRRSRAWLMAWLMAWLCWGSGVCLAQIETIALPNVKVDGKPAKVHSQGLYVTEQHFFVTGRLELKNQPKKALLFRFKRSNPSQYEYLDLTPPHQDGVVLDHPGGFDRDENGLFWIPVSSSKRSGPTVIYGMNISDDRPLKKATSILHSVRFDDHLGALCCIEKNQLLVANWDTADIYWLKTDGKVVKKLGRNQFIADDPDWFLAVQDWKYDRKKRLVVAGGINKSPALGKNAEKATMAWIDLQKKSVTSKPVASLSTVAKPLTNEGMALEKGYYLLPEDLGCDAKIFRFKKF